MPLVKVGKKEEIGLGGAKSVLSGGKDIAVFNVGGEFHAIDNLCLHRGGPLCDGRVDGAVVTCPWHGWQFDVTTGELIMNPATKQKKYAVHIKGGELYVEV